MTTESSALLRMIDEEIDTVRADRVTAIDAALRRLSAELQVSISREVDLLARRERALVPATETVDAPRQPQPFEALMPQIDPRTGRDKRGANVIIRELVTQAGARGMYQRDLDSQAERFGFLPGAIARAKQKLREEGIGTFDSRWRVWRLLTAEERAAWEAQKAASEAA